MLGEAGPRMSGDIYNSQSVVYFSEAAGSISPLGCGLVKAGAVPSVYLSVPNTLARRVAHPRAQGILYLALLPPTTGGFQCRC